ncbi:VOC family protein [Microbacterium sp. 179-B 1A2 NHS]|uniref:VOC family protein n=1 Tax=Microbacterium sp. 179-B 1A2 NHS TaxID=3142383 RepID=UPI0039A386DA
MPLTLNPYLTFRDTARDALGFYHSVLGGDLSLDEFGAFPDMAPEGDEHLIMHGQITTDDGLVLMASDTPSSMPSAPPAGFSVSISGDDEARLQALWDGLSAGGEVRMPYETPPWGGTFGMFTDRFGVDWMIGYSPA